MARDMFAVPVAASFNWKHLTTLQDKLAFWLDISSNDCSKCHTRHFTRLMRLVLFSAKYCIQETPEKYLGTIGLYSTRPNRS